MSYSVGDGLVALALAAGIVGCLWVERHHRLRKLEIRHQERMKALEKDVPLVELEEEADAPAERKGPQVVPLLGIILMAFSLGAMAFLLVNLPADRGGLWIAPLPVAFMGFGLLSYHLMLERPRN